MSRSDFNSRLDVVLDGLRGDREAFRRLLTDRDGMLRELCRYAEHEAKRRRCEPWSVVGSILGRGSGVSSAIYELYREAETEGDVKLSERIYDLISREGSMPAMVIAQRLGVRAAVVGMTAATCNWFERRDGEVHIARTGK